MYTLSFTFSKYKVLLTDLAVFLLVYLIPAATHLLPFPLYYLDPMRVLLFTAYLFSRNNFNAYTLAITIPLFSMLVTGHPVFMKSILISIELFTNLLIFSTLLKFKTIKVPVALFLGIVMSKLAYYTMKYIFLAFGLLGGSLISTGIGYQLVTALGITFLFSFLYTKQK